MTLNRLSQNAADNDALSALSRHMYVKHRNIFIGIGVVIFTGLTSFVVLRNYTYNRRDRLASIRREIQSVTPGTDSVMVAYREKLQRRQEEQQQKQSVELSKN